MFNSLELVYKATLLVMITACCNLTNSVSADGYHYQIQTSAQFLASSAGELHAIQLTWTYAPNEGNQLLADKDLSSTQKEATLKLLGQAMLDDLFESGYYSQLAINGQPILLNKVQEYVVSSGKNQSLTLSFKLPLKTAVKLANQKVELRLVDPDGIATLVFSSPTQARLDENLAKLCSNPKISEETINLPNGHQTTVPTVKISCQ